jgi:hypothetical protein
MRKIFSVVQILLLGLSAQAYAGSQTGQVTQIVKRASDGLIYINMTGQASGRPQCAAAQFYWMIKDENSVTGKQQLAMLMMARATGQTVSVVGSNTCLRWGDGEDVDYVIL